MQLSGVITGDIVGSCKIAENKNLIDALHEVLEILAQRFEARGKVYRGDEFQVLLPVAGDSVLASILIRAAIISHSPSKKQMWDARVAIGIGEVTSHVNKVTESGGEAFSLSGQGLDKIGKSGDRLCILTNSSGVDRQLSLLTRLVDDIISHWSHYSAQVAYLSLLYNESQQALAKRLGRSQPTIHTRLATAKMELVRAYNEYTSELLSSEWIQ
ncbi:MAG: hypothetical protein PVI52_08935 [Chromatiales bacterium]|jgi:hypothetical protein